MRNEMHTIPKTASMREVQRNYRALFDWVHKTNKPLVLTSGSTPYVVVLNVSKYNAIIEHLMEKEKQERQKMREQKWKKIEEQITLLRKAGKQNISLSDFVVKDRERH